MELIQSNLSNLGYNHSISERHFSEGTPNSTFIEVITWLISQLVSLCKLESYVNPINNKEDTLKFFDEVSYLLQELCCPYKSLFKSKITDRLIISDNKKLLVLYLCTELESAKIQAYMKTKKEVSMKIELNESKTADLKEMLIFLRLSKFPETITPQILFGEVEKKLKKLSYPSTPREKIGELLFSNFLMEKQWLQLEYLYKEMYQEYKIRKNLLLTRLEVTFMSFLWADRLKAKTKDIMNIYNKFKSGITLKPSVKLFHVLAAKSDLTVIEKTSSTLVRKNTKSSVNSVVIGAVPDRGGRLEEQQPPPAEVPFWQKNDSSCKRRESQSNHQNIRGSYSRANTGYSRDINSYSTDNNDFSRDTADFKRSGYSRYENSNPRPPADNFKGNIFYRSNKNDYNFQPVNYCPQPINLQFGSGGYMPAGDNFRMYGMTDGMSQMNLINESRSGYGDKGKGGYNRDFNLSRGGIGGRRGRNRN